MGAMDNHELPRDVRAFYAITTALNIAMSEQAVLDALLECTVTELGYRAATLRLLDEEQQILQLRASYGLSQTYLHKGPTAIRHSKIDQAVVAGNIVVIEDVPDSAMQHAESAQHEMPASSMILPLQVHNRTVGILRMYTNAPHPFTATERGLLAAIASIGAQAMCRARHGSAYRSLACAIAASLDLNVVLTELLGHAVRALHIRAASLYLLEPFQNLLHLAAAIGLSAAYRERCTVEVMQSPIDQQVIQLGQPVTMTEMMQVTGLQYPEEAQREGIRAILVVPLRVRDVIIGVLRLYSGQTRRFSEEETTFAAMLAELGAMAIENARQHATLKARLEAMKVDSNAWYRYVTLS